MNEIDQELKEWRSLRLWGETPAWIHEFIRGQQHRILEAQYIEAEFERLLSLWLEWCKLHGHTEHAGEIYRQTMEILNKK
jgi:hypothetical protein